MLSIGWISWRKMLMYIKAEASYKKSQEEVPQHCMDFWWIVYKDRTHVEFHGIIVHWNYFPLFIIWIVNTSIYLWGLSLLLRWGISTHLPTNVCLFATCKYTQWMWRCNGQYCLPSNSSTRTLNFVLPGALVVVAMSGKCLTIIGHLDVNGQQHAVPTLPLSVADNNTDHKLRRCIRITMSTYTHRWWIINEPNVFTWAINYSPVCVEEQLNK